ncbi:hypothetical protein CANCADRAFT_43335 [Tortispora caseinolytica NRRL Y-17796]|uniref:Arrestin-like N-terminal domain-containing protein n=1 Tax=Tortispora caseinolytica NRRL Y-17796 TaxID=767744 RepID=A0A1E4TLZ9_9ASCO|nr:hypothetical protein CANCADRAFT_43335 [Tortispora caseinolytica NRRL Y-17796]
MSKLRQSITELRPALPVSKPGGVELYIDLSEPLKVYKPGDQIRGDVVLQCTKSLPTTAVDLALIGEVTLNGDSLRSKAITHTILKDHVRLWQRPETDAESPKNITLAKDLPPGEHLFQFIFQLPKSPLPNSVDFDLGSISYTLLATHRRQSAYSTTKAHLKLRIQTPINISRLQKVPPSNIEVSLRPRKSKKHTALYPTYSVPTSSHSPALGPASKSSSSSSSSSSLSASTGSAVSPATLANETARTASSPEADPDHSAPTSQRSASALSRNSTSNINVTISGIPAGVLKGDDITVSISASHINEVRSLTGVILTFCRLSRIAVGQNEQRSFRKDLAQVTLPLYVNHTTMSVDVQGTLRVPLSVFPTTKAADLVSFSYGIETIIDLAGVLNNSELVKPSHESPFIDTGSLKRVRGVISVWHNIIVGTVAAPPPASASRASSRIRSRPSDLLHPSSVPQHNRPQTSPGTDSHNPSHSSTTIPVTTHPTSHSTRPRSEKEQIRLAELRLLPSSPSMGPTAAQLHIAPAEPSPLHLDKLERERMHLQRLQSEPVYHYRDDMTLPLYEESQSTHAPSASNSTSNLNTPHMTASSPADLPDAPSPTAPSQPSLHSPNDSQNTETLSETELSQSMTTMDL